MALGIDSAAHLGALEAAGSAPPVAVLAGGAETAYPARMRHLHARLIAAGAVVSEMPPGFGGHRWCFPARNRIIAALSTLTIVVEAATRSGSLITADLATDLGRTVAAVPGPVTSRTSAGSNELLHAGAAVIRDARDVLDLLFGADAPRIPDAPLPPLEPAQRRLLDQVERGLGTVAELAHTMEEAQHASRTLSELELLGLVRREFGGRYVRLPRRTATALGRGWRLERLRPESAPIPLAGQASAATPRRGAGLSPRAGPVVLRLRERCPSDRRRRADDGPAPRPLPSRR